MSEPDKGSEKVVVTDGTDWEGPLRAHAAIKLKVPESGIDWLDEMILKSQRNEIAVAALPCVYSWRLEEFRTAPPHSLEIENEEGKLAQLAYEMADAMLQARKRNTP